MTFLPSIQCFGSLTATESQNTTRVLEEGSGLASTYVVLLFLDSRRLFGGWRSLLRLLYLVVRVCWCRGRPRGKRLLFYWGRSVTTPPTLLHSLWCITYIHTVWKYHYFSITQILREINLGESRSAKNAVFAILGALKLVDLMNFSLQKVQKCIEVKIQSL